MKMSPIRSILDAKKVIGLSGNFEGGHLVMQRSE